MQDTNFNFYFVWDHWIIPIIKKAFDDVDLEFKKYVNMEICNLDSKKKIAADYAQQLRLQLKKEYYGPCCIDLQEKHLSFSKLSAIICATLIKNKVIKFDTKKAVKYKNEHKISDNDTQWLVFNVLINYRIAFYASMSFLYHSMEFLYDDEEEFLEKLKQQKKLKFYITNENVSSESHEPFDYYLIINMAKRDFNKKDFDYFLYAAMMLGLQEYNKLLLS